MRIVRRFIIISVIQILCVSINYSQELHREELLQIDHTETEWCKEMFGERPNLIKAEIAYTNYFQQNPNEESKLRNIFMRWLEDAKLSRDKEGYHIPNPFPPSAFLKPKEKTSAAGSWESVGPNFADRTQCGSSSFLSGGFCDRVYINPYNNNNLLAGFSYGGLWVSNDLSESWTLSDADIPNGTNSYANRDLYYGEIEASALNADLLYVASEYGLLKSINAGENWTICPQLNREDAGNIRSYYIALSKENQNTVLATFGRQVFRSTDGGDTWAIVFDNTNGGDNHYYTSQYSNNSTFGIYDRTYNFFGLERAESTSDVFYLGVWNALNRPEIYKSIDGGASFNLLINLQEELDRELPSNLVLKASQEYEDRFYLHALFTFDSLYQFQQDGQLLERSLINAADFSVNTLEAFSLNPANEDMMYAGFYFSSAIMKSEDGGNNFIDQTSGYAGCPKYVHPDVRSIDVQGDLVLIGSDGGVAISTDAMNTVISDIGREISSIDLWGFSSSPRTDLIAVGCDHGPTKVRRNGNQENSWISIGGGDASDLSINSSNEEWMVFDRAIGNQHRCKFDDNNDILEEESINNEIDLDQIAFHPYLYQVAFAKQGQNLRQTQNNFNTLTTNSSFPANIIVHRIAPDNPDVFYLITNDSELRKSIDGGANWTIITPPTSVSNGETNIRDVVIGANENEIWAAYGNWQKEAKILKSTDGGLNWENISTNNLPLTPVSQIAYQAGTDGGVYLAFAGNSGVWYRNNSMAEWIELGSGLPTVGYIRNVFTVPNKGKIRIGSSRGVWEHDLYEASNPVANFAIANNSIGCGEQISYIQNSTHAPKSVTYQWTFPGGTPETSTEAEPSVFYWQAGQYGVSLTITDENGDSDTQELVGFISVEDNANCAAVKVTEHAAMKMKVYPIPAHNKVYVELSQRAKQVSVQIVTTGGQLMKEQLFKNKSRFSVDISGFPVGVYFLQIEDGLERAQVKIVRE